MQWERIMTGRPMVARKGHEEAPEETVPRGRGAHPPEQDGEGGDLPLLLFLQARSPSEEYGKHIDFLNICEDEGHKNLDMHDELEEYTKWGSIGTVQIVVTKNDIGALETKIRRCQDAGVKAVVMCAVHLKNTKDHLPDLWSMSKVGLELKKKYPEVMISRASYFTRIT